MVRRVVWFDHILLITCDGKRSICTKSENSFSASDICICKKRYGFVKIYPISHLSMFQYFLFLTKTRDSILGYINIFKQFFHHHCHSLIFRNAEIIDGVQSFLVP